MATNTAHIAPLNPTRIRSLVFPREHGAWGILLVPLVSGAVIGSLSGDVYPEAVLALVLAALALFLLRTPVESLLGSSVFKVRTGEERSMVLGFLVAYSGVAVVALLLLMLWVRFLPLLVLGLVAGAAFALQAWIGRRSAAARTLAQLIGSLGLTSTAAGAYFAATGDLDRTAFVLWAGNWLFAANQIHYVHLRIRAARAGDRAEKLLLGRGFLAAEALTLLLLVAAVVAGLAPGLAALAFHPILLRGAFWFLVPPKPLVIKRLGFTELIHAILFAVFLIVGYVLDR